MAIKNREQLPQWVNLKKHYKTISKLALRDLFIQDPERVKKFSITAAGLMLEYSKNRIVPETIDLFSELAMACELPQKIRALFEGASVNVTENQPALHTALRDSTNTSIWVDERDILIEIRENIEKMLMYSEKIRQGRWLGYSGQPVTDVVNLGIGGSDLGPSMVCEALSAFKSGDIHCHFISNADSFSILNLLNTLNPETTLFIIASKSFSTKETLLNAKTARHWLGKEAFNSLLLKNHFLAVTAAPQDAIAFGIDPEHIFNLPQWVGGRYSVWSAIGLPIALSIGMESFKSFLAGAHAMDQHFLSAKLQHNMPVILGLLGIWYINFFGLKTQAVLPYCESLKKLPAYLQQTEMESNGKSVSLSGKFIRYFTSPLVFGEIGTNSQHAFHQLLHQGTQIIPVDFILSLKNRASLSEHQDLLISSCLSQSRALMMGKRYTEAYDELLSLGYSKELAKWLASHKTLPGNRPSNTIVLSELTPYSLGALLALYEHKVFVQSIIWDINCFDQWGIELGKQTIDTLLTTLHERTFSSHLDSSTRHLLQLYLEAKVE